MHIVQLIQFYNVLVFSNNLHLFMSHSLMSVFPCWLLQHHNCRVLYYFLLLPSSFLCCSPWLLLSHEIYAISCFVISVIVVHSYKVSLVFWYIAYCGCMYVATVNIEKCLSINNINKCVGEHTRAWDFDIVAGCSTDGSKLVHTFDTGATSVMSSVC